jgi:hypothetical protein
MALFKVVVGAFVAVSLDLFRIRSAALARLARSSGEPLARCGIGAKRSAAWTARIVNRAQFSSCVVHRATGSTWADWLQLFSVVHPKEMTMKHTPATALLLAGMIVFAGSALAGSDNPQSFSVLKDVRAERLSKREMASITGGFDFRQLATVLDQLVYQPDVVKLPVRK